MGPYASPTAACTHCRYDDEEEFDAVKDVLAPKRVFLVLPPESPQQLEHLRSKLSSLSFDAGFMSQQACSPSIAHSKMLSLHTSKLGARTPVMRFPSRVHLAKATGWR